MTRAMCRACVPLQELEQRAADLAQQLAAQQEVLLEAQGQEAQLRALSQAQAEALAAAEAWARELGTEVRLRGGRACAARACCCLGPSDEAAP